MSNLEKNDNSIQEPLTTNIEEISSILGFFMGSCEAVLGIGIYNMFGNDLFSSAKDLSGDVGLTAFKSLIEAVGHQIEAILPSETTVQFIAPENILVGVSKISSDQLLAVILNRDAQISNIIPNIIDVARLLQGVASKTTSLSNEQCMTSCQETIARRTVDSPRKNLVNRFAS